MLKKLLFIALLMPAFACHSFAQEDKDPPVTLTRTDAGFSFEKVFEVPNVTKDELYKRVKQWISANIKSAEKNTFDDVDMNTIATDITLLMVKNNWAKEPVVNFKLAIFFKDGKYKITASQFLLEDYNTITPFDNLNKMYFKKTRVIEYEDFDTKFTAILTGIQGAAEKKDGGNW